MGRAMHSDMFRLRRLPAIYLSGHIVGYHVPRQAGRCSFSACHLSLVLTGKAWYGRTGDLCEMAWYGKWKEQVEGRAKRREEKKVGRKGIVKIFVK